VIANDVIHAGIFSRIIVSLEDRVGSFRKEWCIIHLGMDELFWGRDHEDVND
jgi:hypothetical protein